MRTIRYLLRVAVPALGIVCQGCSEATQSGDSATGTVDVVVAVLGYRSGYRLVTGEYVDGFTTDTNNVEYCRGFMFQVLSPTNHSGKLLYSHHDGLLPAGNPAQIYQIGKRYRFRVEENYLLEVRDSGCGCVTAADHEPVEVPPKPSELKSMIEELNREYAKTARSRAGVAKRTALKDHQKLMDEYDQTLLYIEKQRAVAESLLEFLEGGKETQPPVPR